MKRIGRNLSTVVAAVALLSLAAAPASAAAITLDFEGIAVGTAVGEYYNGVGGPDYDISFVVGNGGRPGTIRSGGVVRQFIANIPNGFDTGITLDFVAVPVGSAISIYSDVDMGGTVLFTQGWSDTIGTVTASFSGTGKSIQVSHWSGEPTFDNLHFSNLNIADVPEPATMSLLAIGGLAALIRRKRQ
ncbi:MAG: PEP-CTERM sorting domain-containing protein [Planctomycetaceae bacterium]|nr:PEP-CTERM sorting domain-containing protein [Planctomycetaceae bacterium]